ncbi:expressed protein [Phakopsora pachyrhizi]|uniref:Expressed protein n=1 Tax=Phakopsora pachyrhizi TaxID=170000 RepID=A0AAV0AIC1_PHAPC|nr:expressed protein [Phakopsora pachyrhizi]
MYFFSLYLSYCVYSSCLTAHTLVLPIKNPCLLSQTLFFPRSSFVKFVYYSILKSSYPAFTIKKRSQMPGKCASLTQLLSAGYIF